ncbi:hypothetical protein CHARACLAT_023776 [Characodon lateralis]|uniref:Uncharacterized protein n=1 Tax=Characodon lateralis TaxID=208331 RepID=A0ABU7DJP9_9TELE|nr:hypothetical protein [Characodon lateralis]
MCGWQKIISQQPSEAILQVVSRLPCVGALLCFDGVSLLPLVMMWLSIGLPPRAGRGSEAIPAHQAESQCCDAARGDPLWVCCTWGTHSEPPAISQDTCIGKETYVNRKRHDTHALVGKIQTTIC